MLSNGSAAYLLVPFIVICVVGVLALILRWGSAPGGSLVERRIKPGDPDEYGVLVPVAAPNTYVEGEVVRRTLEASGVRATLAQTNDGPRVMVFPDDEQKARALLRK